MEKWVMLGLSSGFSLLMGSSFCVFSTIPAEAEDFYGESGLAISMFALCYMAAYLVTCVPTSWLLHRSLQRSLQGAGVCMGVGALLRLLAWDNYALALTGQCLIALGNCVSLASCSTVAELWFPQHQALLATAIGTLANGVGVGGQLVLSCLLCNVPLLLGIQAALCVTEAVLLVFLFKADPVHEGSSFSRSDLKRYVENWRAMGFLLLSGATNGAVSAFLGLLYAVLGPAGYSSLQTGFVGLTFSWCGMAGGVGSSFIVARCRYFNQALQLYLLVGIVCSIAMCFAVVSYPLLLVVSGIYGAGAVGFMPLAIRAAVEGAPAIDPSVPPNIIFFTSQIVGMAQSGLALGFQETMDFSALYLLALFTATTLGLFLILYQVDSPSSAEAAPLKMEDIEQEKQK